MSDVRSVPGSGLPTAPTRPLPAARAQAIAAAQKAFFDQALNAAPATVPVRPAAAAETASSRPQAQRLEFDPAGQAPSRVLRPGSLLDIKV